MWDNSNGRQAIAPGKQTYLPKPTTPPVVAVSVPHKITQEHLLPTAMFFVLGTDKLAKTTSQKHMAPRMTFG